CRKLLYLEEQRRCRCKIYFLFQGWDFDPSGAPGAVPKEHYIQTTFIHRSQSSKLFYKNFIPLLGPQSKAEPFFYSFYSFLFSSSKLFLQHFRSGEDLMVEDHSLQVFTSQTEFNSALSTYKHVFVLFWSNDVVVAHVECHTYVDFCDGLLLGSSPSSVIIGTFPDRECSELQHFSIAADRLHGRYHMAIMIKPGVTATVSAYRPNEKRRRQDYEGKFDPASLIVFISTASLPSVIDISYGFTTNLLFRQPRLVAVLVDSPSFSNSSYFSLATKKDARKSVIFTFMNRLQSFIVCSLSLHIEQLLRILLSVRDPHPLRVLQKASVDHVFTSQNTLILPDETLYHDLAVSRPSN
uniref:DCAF15_WD40 domain-containing protein n=1 Tax=Angiostrongylus cantonensis TaxID=6313 RepID=A0A158PBS1_ANGCA